MTDLCRKLLDLFICSSLYNVSGCYKAVTRDYGTDIVQNRTVLKGLATVIFFIQNCFWHIYITYMFEACQ